MKFDEFKVLVKGMKSAYTSANFLPDSNAVKIWYQLLQDMSYEQLNIAIQKHMLTNKFPPTIAELRAMAASCMVEHKDWSCGWEQARRAIRKFGYYQQEEAFASMDEITRKVVRRLGWKELCMSENTMQDRANFRMIYEQEQSHSLETEMLPEAIQRQIGRMQGKVIAGKIEGRK